MQLSLAVLVLYRSWVVFSLGGCFPPIFPSHCQGQVLCLQHDLGPFRPTWVSHFVPRLSSRVRPIGPRVAHAEGEPHISLAISAKDSVWALPVSLAATSGISVDFSSCWYSDVSFPSVRDPCGSPGRLAAIPVGYHPFGHPRIKRCMRLPGAYRSLPRPSSPPKPSHPPYGVGAYG